VLIHRNNLAVKFVRNTGAEGGGAKVMPYGFSTLSNCHV